MGSIYQNATEVAIWLSEATEFDATTLEFMNFVGESMRCLNALDDKSIATAWLSKFDIIEIVEMEVKLSQLPYWTRTWIMQETALAPTSTFLICGNRKFLWSNIMDFAYCFNKRRSPEFSNAHILSLLGKSAPRLAQDFISFNTHMMCLHDIFMSVQLRDQIPKEKAICDWFGSLFLRLASMSQCKDSRDRIYGLMNLFPGDLASKLKPEYDVSNTTSMVMAEFVMVHIEETGSLSRLQIATDISPTIDEWPSWVPNFSVPFKDFTMSWHVKSGHLNSSQWAASEAKEYRADRGKKASNVQRGPATTFGVPNLICSGIKLDVISEAAVDDRANMFKVTRFERLCHGQSDDEDEIMLDVIRMWLKNEPQMELESLAWMIKDIVSSELERRKNPSRSAVAKTGSHKYGDDVGLKSALESCFTAVGWTLNSSRNDITSIFDVPRTSKGDLIQALQAGDLLKHQLQFNFSDMCDRASQLDLWDQNLNTFFTTNSDPKPYVNSTNGPMLAPLDDGHRRARGNLFTTVGGYVGASLDRIWPGDEVWILFGLPMPAVLRRGSGGMRLVGKVYVHGVMDGEGLEEKESGEVCIV
jgi:hypothetical protein